MKGTSFIVVRHGQTVWNLEHRRLGHQDSPLTPLGAEQTEKLAARLANQIHDVIYSSDLGRAVETANRIKQKSGKEIFLDQRLRERDYGVFEGLTRIQMRERYPQEFLQYRTAPDYAIPNGESAVDFSRRCIHCLEEIAQKHKGETAIVVTHLGVLDCAFRHLLGIPLHVPRRFKIPEGSVNVMNFKAGRWTLESWGDISHLK